MSRAHAWQRDMPALLGPVALLAGALLLTGGLLADLRVHAETHHGLEQRLPASVAALVEHAAERERTNPWHAVLATGQVLLTGGLATLYLAERRDNRRMRQATCAAHGVQAT